MKKIIILLQLIGFISIVGCGEKYYSKKFTKLYDLKSAFNLCDSNIFVDGNIIEFNKSQVVIYTIKNGIVDSTYNIYNRKNAKLERIVKQAEITDTVKCQGFNKKTYYKYFQSRELYFKSFRPDGSPFEEYFNYGNIQKTIGYSSDSKIEYIIFKGIYPDSTAYFYKDGRFAGYKLRFSDHEIQQKIVYYVD